MSVINPTTFARRVPGQGLSLLLYSPARDGEHIKCSPVRAELATNLTPAPAPGGQTSLLITDMKWALAYRPLAWHGTILAALIHELVELLMAESRAERRARRALMEATEESKEEKSSTKSKSSKAAKSKSTKSRLRPSVLTLVEARIRHLRLAPSARIKIRLRLRVRLWTPSLPVRS